MCGELRDEVLRIVARHRALVPSTEIIFDRVRSAAGLIAGTVPTKGKVGQCTRK